MYRVRVYWSNGRFAWEAVFACQDTARTVAAEQERLGNTVQCIYEPLVRG